MPTQRRATLNHSLALDPVARACALAVLLIGLLVLAGWALKIEALKSVLPGLASMKPNTALCFVLAGIALALRRRSGLRLGCAAAMFVLGGLSLAQDVTGADFGTDQLLFRDLPDAAQTVSPGRMAPITAVSLILLGGALALLGSRRSALHWTQETLVLLALALTLPALIGYAYGTPSFYPLPGFGSMSLPTALALPLLALGILCARADGLAGVFASAGLGGQVARRSLPLALIAPVLLGWLAQIGENTGLFVGPQNTAVFAAAMLLVLVALCGRIAHSLEVSDAERQRAEATQARLAMIVETSDDAIISKSIDGAILTWNAGAERMFGYPAAEAVGQPITLLIPLEQLHEEEQILQRLRRGEGIEHFETVRLAKDGRHLEVSLTISPLKDAGGRVVGASKILRNIGARKQADVALRESEQRLRALVSASSDVVYRMSPDWREMHRLHGQNFIVDTAAPSDNWLAEYIHPDDQQRVMAVVHEAIRTKSLFEMEHRVRTVDGSLGWTFSRAVPLLDAKGEIVEWFGTASDVTVHKRAEQALRESEERYRSLFNSIDAGFCVIDMIFDAHGKAVDYRFLEVNPVFEKQTGLHDVTGKRISELNPDIEEHWFETYGKVASTGEAIRFVNQAKAMDARWFDVYAFRLGGPESSKVALLFSDITERKRRERNLGFLADLQKVFTPLTSAADNMRVASQRIAELLQLNHCVLAEIDEAAQTATVLHDHHAADAPPLAAVYRIEDFLGEAERQELAAGRTLVIDDVRSDARTKQQMDRFAALGARAMVETSYVVGGRVKFLVAATRAEPHAWAPEDVELLTELAARLCARLERARAEERLVESEERMRLAAEAAGFGMYDRGVHGAYFHISAQIKQMLGYAPDAQLDHRQVMSHFHPDDRAAGMAAYRRACRGAGDGRIDIEQRVVRRDGVVRWIATVGQLICKDGAPARSVGFWVDITERKEAEAVLRMRGEELRVAAEVALASKFKSEFLANMSHELRTPLNSLLILSELLADNKDRNLTPKQVEFAQVMHQSGSDLLRLINEILDLSRIEAGQVEVYIEAVALANLREKIERDFRHVAQAKQLEFGVSLDPQLPAIIRSDANRLEQVLKNLLANSFKFTEKGSVKLAIHRAADGWSRPHASLDQAEGVIAFTVADSGIGIAPEKQQLIFDAFAQVDGTTSRKYGGSGLGLSISRELASLLGGAIALTSEAGVGSAFTLYLPFTYSAASAARHPKAEPEPTGRQVVAAPPPIAVHGPVEDDRAVIAPGDDVVLIVEYDPVFARLLLEIAHRHAFKGLVASTAAAALQLARQHQPAAITLSVTLPDMDGWTLLQHVNDDLGLRHIPVHIVSGEDERPRGLRQGAASYLQKPASEAVLGALFERIRAAKVRPHSLLLVVEDDPAMQRQIVQAIGASADVKTTPGASADVQTTLVASAEEGLAELKARRYDCVVLDLRLPGMSGYEFLEAVRDELRIDDLPIVVYTGTDLSSQQRARLRQLAESVLVKDARSLDRLLDQTSLYLHRRVSAVPDAARATLERLHADTHQLPGTKVLVVDDDMRNVFALFAILENAGIEAKHVEDGIQCLDMLEATAGFDAVLMDIMMPGMDGYETMRRIRKLEGFDSLPVIALTAKAMKGDREKCIDAGASDYLTKPVDPERLLALLRYWICP